MVPCTIMSHIELGQVNKDSLLDVWQHHPELERLRARRSVSLKEFAFCQGCEYLAYCRGSCPAMAYNIAGDDFHPSPDSCLRNFIQSGGVLPYLEDLAI